MSLSRHLALDVGGWIGRAGDTPKRMSTRESEGSEELLGGALAEASLKLLFKLGLMVSCFVRFLWVLKLWKRDCITKVDASLEASMLLCEQMTITVVLQRHFR